MSRYKTIDRKVNRVARKLNKQLAEDELWRGRFEVRQYQKAVETFSDGSKIGQYNYRIYDKKTGKFATMGWTSEFRILRSAALWSFANDAIIKNFKVWDFDKDDPNYPYNDKTDYTKISI